MTHRPAHPKAEHRAATAGLTSLTLLSGRQPRNHRVDGQRKHHHNFGTTLDCIWDVSLAFANIFRSRYNPQFLFAVIVGAWPWGCQPLAMLSSVTREIESPIYPADWVDLAAREPAVPSNEVVDRPKKRRNGQGRQARERMGMTLGKERRKHGEKHCLASPCTAERRCKDERSWGEGKERRKHCLPLLRTDETSRG